MLSALLQLERETSPALMHTILKRCHTPVYASRIQALVRGITPHLQPGDRILDVGCGSGVLGRAILNAATCPARVQLHGIEQMPRGHEPIAVQAYEGLTIPHAERSYDVVVLADVLHHAVDPERLLDECIRVSKRLVIIKDHQANGPLAQQRLALLDWLANAPYGVPCLYRYWTAAQWTEAFQRHQLIVEEAMTSMKLYPRGLDLIFGGPLHLLAVLKVPGASAQEADRCLEKR